MPVKFPLAERRARRIGGAKLLLAVADPVASGPMKRALQAQGYGVLECDDGEQALAAARHEAFEVLLLDQNLGAIDGIELCRKQCRTRVRAPILLFASANDQTWWHRRTMPAPTM